MELKVIALAGNPNVGKSTVFNGLTGLNQHTGNWPGKTVTNAQGKFTYKDKSFVLVDIPGTYSLMATSVEEEIARDYICSGEADVIVVVTDATCLERNLNLVLQILEITTNVVVCVNLLDEAKKKKIHIDLGSLSNLLGVPVVGTVARSKKSLEKLKEQIYFATLIENAGSGNSRHHFTEEEAENIIRKASFIYRQCVSTENRNYNYFDRKIDRIVTSRTFGIPLMILLLGMIFWITIVGANYPSGILSDFFLHLEGKLLTMSEALELPTWLEGSLILGVYKTLTWVISVMLPPMAIFFPLFTLLEDFGYLPRVAFNMDQFFRKASAHGKQSLTMCMGFGCNACGVIGCRIIDSPRERLIAILTNNFVPCNGRFPTLIAIITMFFITSDAGPTQTVLSTLLLLGVILLGIFLTLMMSKILSGTILKGIPSSFALELPPYRRPQFGKVILRSILDRTLFVLGRAVIIAAPAGLIIWALANTFVGEASLLAHCTDFLDPFARLLGIDGVILMAFILGFPANEIVVPIMIMCYMATGNITELDSLDQLKALFVDNGWTWLTALCTMLLCLLHFPCGTTCLTIKKETQSLKWTLLAFLIPTAAGFTLCFIVASIGRLFI
ncbi:ferrous iron transporter B [Sinanaerobacter chloroacetimidivorans]|uniref:Ferrous iron transporter B n=1 Tax=Sinanaerobacter chloroacetimidivorans TaxID=2818044 RepID=A0A8J8B089_9FIRM|nr:ferrous iron transporter B [Sinanaerobacter chloroacetimidivorans]MBR0596949.1 ferrous iron transporter B [Sinanaerobacter chloroacetimidivorans]